MLTNQKKSSIQDMSKIYLNSEKLRRVNFELNKEDALTNSKKTNKSMKNILEPAAKCLKKSFR